MYRYALLIVLSFLYCLCVKAQAPDLSGHRNKADSLNMKRDSAISKPFVPKVKKEKVYHPDSTHSPHKAIIKSLIFPGLGQIYNRHGLWWRLPAIYGGIGALMYNIYTNGKDYKAFLRESEWRAHGRPPAPDGSSGEPLPDYQGLKVINVGDPAIYDYKDNLRRNRDLSIFSLIGAWGINMIDAYVEAKFIHSYSMDNNLSFKVTPSVIGQPVYASNFNTTFTPSLKITFTF